MKAKKYWEKYGYRLMVDAGRPDAIKGLMNDLVKEMDEDTDKSTPLTQASSFVKAAHKANKKWNKIVKKAEGILGDVPGFKEDDFIAFVQNGNPELYAMGRMVCDVETVYQKGKTDETEDTDD